MAVYLTTIYLYNDFVSSISRGNHLSRAEALYGKHDVTVHETSSTDFVKSKPYEAPKASKIGSVLLTGIPHQQLPFSNAVTVATNILLALFALDLIFRGPVLYPATSLKFSRLGYVDTTSAKVLFRESDRQQLPIYAYYRANESTVWHLADKIYYLGEASDYTYPLTFSPLQPQTSYTYTLSNGLNGTFTTAPDSNSLAGGSLTFLTSSCIKANFPYNPLSHGLDIHGFEHLSRVLGLLRKKAQFMLFLGDFIYVDVPLRLASAVAHYRAEYRRVYASPSWSLPHLFSLSWLHTLDDHEIANDWARGNSTPPFPAARDPFQHYHVSVNPPLPPDAPRGNSEATYFQFSRGPASFFMLETRAYRTQPVNITASSTAREQSSNATILGAAELSSLLRFLHTAEPKHIHWKIIASSVPFTKNWRFGSTDTWAGFPAERARVLEAMHHAEHHLGVRVIILSGDRHEFGAVRYPYHSSTPSSPPAPAPPQHHSAEPPFLSFSADQDFLLASSNTKSGPHEFSVGPLSMFYLPYPFRTFKQTDDEDVAIKYIPEGNSKVGVVDIEGVEGDDVRSLLRYSLYIDGQLKWEYLLASPAPDYLSLKHRQTGLGARLLWGD